MPQEMKYNDLGRTGLRVSRIGYGCAALGNCYGPLEENDAIRCVRRAVDEYGINYFDTSPSYGMLAETRLGEALSGGRREKVILATKCGDYIRPDGAGGKRYETDFTSKAVREGLEESLRRLRTDRVDVLQIHDVDKAEPQALLEDVIPEMLRLKEQGKTRFLGITGRHLGSLRYLLERSDEIDVVLTFGRYNLMDVSAETALDDLQERRGFALLNCSVLYMGLLTQRFLNRQHRFMDYYERRPDFPEKWKGFEKVAAMCREKGVDFGELAYQFGCDCSRFDSTVISAGSTARLEQNMGLLEKPYDRDFALRVSEILRPCSFLPDAWE